MKAINTKSLCKEFGKTKAITNLDLEVAEGEIFTLLGANGAGKTTTINLLTTLLRPSSGTALIFGKDIIQETRLVRKAVALMPQGNALDPFLNVYDNLLFYAKLAGLSRDIWQQRMEELLVTLDLIDKVHSPVMALSGGQFRRVQLIRVLLSNSPMVFLDEPTLGVDIYGKIKIWDLIKCFKKLNNWTILLSTNDMSEAEYLSDRIALMKNGLAKRIGSSNELKDRIISRKIKIKYINKPENVPLNINGFKVKVIDDHSIDISVNNANREIGSVLSGAVQIGKIEDVSIESPDLTDVFRDLQEGE